MKVEVFHATGCAKCLRRLNGLRTAAREVEPSVEWSELDILKSLDYAVKLGVFTPPAIAIDGELVFPSLPTPDALTAAMRRRLDATR